MDARFNDFDVRKSSASRVVGQKGSRSLLQYSHRISGTVSVRYDGNQVRMVAFDFGRMRCKCLILLIVACGSACAGYEDVH